MGLSTHLTVLRKVGGLMRYLKDKEEDAGVKVISYFLGNRMHLCVCRLKTP